MYIIICVSKLVIDSLEADDSQRVGEKKSKVVGGSAPVIDWNLD